MRQGHEHVSISKSMADSDEYLVRLAQNGSDDAYNRLFERYLIKIRQVIYFNTRDEATMNDLVQEVLLKVFRYLSDFKEECLFSTWLYRIIHNIIKNHYRSLSLRADSEAQFAYDQPSLLGDSPEHLLIGMELTEQVELALSHLSEELRSCYGKYLFEGQTYEDIAKEMQCPIGTVRSRISRARKLLMGFCK